MVCSFHCCSGGKTSEGAFGTSRNRELFTCAGGEFVRDGLVKRLEVPVITGCIFVRVSEMNLPSVLSIGGVIALLKEKQGPVVISDEQLACTDCP